MSYSSPKFVVSILLLLTLVSVLALPVNPWPRDGWFESQYRLFAQDPGGDNYVPATIPALYFKGAHWVANLFGLGLRGEFYVASVGQNILVWLSACLVFFSIRIIGLKRWAGWVAAAMLAYLLSAGLPQAMWSETTVLFMFAAAIYLNLRVYSRGSCSWNSSFASGLLIALMVVTRVTPIFMIPALAILLLYRVPWAQYLRHLGIVSLTTVVIVLLAMAANDWRFGRFELSNSSGRHLWQGVTTFVDSALGDSPEFASLKQLNPDLQGKDWWEVKTQNVGWADGGDELLHRLATDAIRSEPLTYVGVGLTKFAKSIFSPLYRLGFGGRGEHPNPLNTEALLPAPASLMGTGFQRIGEAVAVSFEWFFLLIRTLHPVAVLLVLTTASAVLVRALTTARPASTTLSRLALALHVIVCCASLFLILWRSRGLVVVPIMAASIVVVTLQLIPLFSARKAAPSVNSDIRLDVPVFFFLGAMFFGSLWFSWQIEMANSRNTVPYLPFLAIMCAMGIEYLTATWRDYQRGKS